MKQLVITNFGSDVQGIELHGNPAQPEPAEIRIAFPGGDVTVARTSDVEYWIHVRVNQPEDLIGNDDAERGRIVDARLDINDPMISHIDLGDFRRPGLYHLAVLVAHGEEPVESCEAGTCRHQQCARERVQRNRAARLARTIDREME